MQVSFTPSLFLVLARAAGSWKFGLANIGLVEHTRNRPQLWSCTRRTSVLSPTILPLRARVVSTLPGASGNHTGAGLECVHTPFLSHIHAHLHTHTHTRNSNVRIMTWILRMRDVRAKIDIFYALRRIQVHIWMCDRFCIWEKRKHLTCSDFGACIIFVPQKWQKCNLYSLRLNIAIFSSSCPHNMKYTWKLSQICHFAQLYIERI